MLCSPCYGFIDFFYLLRQVCFFPPQKQDLHVLKFYIIDTLFSYFDIVQLLCYNLYS